MSEKKQPAPDEVPKPDTDPEIEPGIGREEPIPSGGVPEINPEKYPVDPTPPEILEPPQKSSPDIM